MNGRREEDARRGEDHLLQCILRPSFSPEGTHGRFRISQSIAQYWCFCQVPSYKVMQIERGAHACMQENGVSAGPAAHHTGRQRRSPAELVPLIMLPVLVWLALDMLHITPRPSQQRIAPKPGVVTARNDSTAGPAEPPAPPPAPPEWAYWQKVSDLSS